MITGKKPTKKPKASKKAKAAPKAPKVEAKAKAKPKATAKKETLTSRVDSLEAKMDKILEILSAK
mgnify:CR=1 FL=1